MYVYVSFPNRQKHKCSLSTRGCPPRGDSLNNNHSLLWSHLCLLESSTSTSSSTSSRQKAKEHEGAHREGFIGLTWRHHSHSIG